MRYAVETSTSPTQARKKRNRSQPKSQPQRRYRVRKKREFHPQQAGQRRALSLKRWRSQRRTRLTRRKKTSEPEKPEKARSQSPRLRPEPNLDGPRRNNPGRIRDYTSRSQIPNR